MSQIHFFFFFRWIGGTSNETQRPLLHAWDESLSLLDPTRYEFPGEKNFFLGTLRRGKIWYPAGKAVTAVVPGLVRSPGFMRQSLGYCAQKLRSHFQRGNGAASLVSVI